MIDALHASAPPGYKCADCTMDNEPCPVCYAAWWQKRHPETHMVGVGDTELNAMRAELAAANARIEDLKSGVTEANERWLAANARAEAAEGAVRDLVTALGIDNPDGTDLPNLRDALLELERSRTVTAEQLREPYAVQAELATARRVCTEQTEEIAELGDKLAASEVGEDHLREQLTAANQRAERAEELLRRVTGSDSAGKKDMEDAARYRWLMTKRMEGSDEAWDAVNALDDTDQASFDASIDAALAQAQASGEGKPKQETDQ